MMTNTNVSSKRILSLEFLRFFALFVIILSHFDLDGLSQSGGFYKTYLHNPVWGVDYFFLLSGFGLFLSNKDKMISCKLQSSLLFAMKKIKKLYVPYILSFLIYLPFYVAYDGANIFVQIIKFMINLTMLQSLSGISTISMSINGVCWFVSSLFICYIIAPFMMFFIKEHCQSKVKSVVCLCFTTLLILLFSKFFLLFQSKYTLFNDLYYGSPYIRVFYVFLGMLIANLFSQMDNKKTYNLFFFEIMFVFAWLLYFVFRNMLQETFCLDPIVIRLFDLIIAIGCFVFSFNNKIAQFMSKRNFFIMLGGKMGMYLFLLHYPVRLMVDSVFKRFEFNKDVFQNVIEIILILGITFPLCLLVKKLNEKILG